MKYFTMSELTHSATAVRKGIDNTPDNTAKANLTALVANILDPLREAYGKPIVVSSGYRCAKLNRAVGGVARSQHITGQAADIQSVSKSKADHKKLFELAQRLRLPYDQLIDEYDYKWVHISFNTKGNRRQVLHVK
jgi:uncharacterized protein YcbK (DUF882 family)